MSYYDYQDGLRAGSAERIRLRDDLNAAASTIGLQRAELVTRADKLRKANATIAALQQSLDEATAKINSNTPDVFINYPVKRRTFTPKPEPIKIGDIVKYKGGQIHYRVECIFPVDGGSLYPNNPKVRIRAIGGQGTYYGRLSALIKVTS